MKVMKKLLSLCLVLSMLCAMALPAMAAEADFVVTTDKSTYEVGETAYVTLTLNTTFTVANVNMRIWYDPNVFTYDAEKSTIGAELNKLMLKNLTDPVESNYSSEPNFTEKGWKPINVSGAYLGSDIAIGSGTLATLAFTVTAACESAVFEHTIIQLNTADASTSYKETATSASATVTVQDAAVAVTGITLDKSELELMEGETATLVPTVTPDYATDKTVTWTSSDETVVKVADGVVTTVNAGTATITAKAGDFSATCAVTVYDWLFTATADGAAVDILYLPANSNPGSFFRYRIDVPVATKSVAITGADSGWMYFADTGNDSGTLGGGSKGYNGYEAGSFPAGLQYADGVLTVDLSTYEESPNSPSDFGLETATKGQYMIDMMSNTDWYEHVILINVLPCETHNWTDATCTTPKTCSVCGATEGEKNPDAHKYVDGKCEYCQAAEPSKSIFTATADGNAVDVLLYKELSDYSLSSYRIDVPAVTKSVTITGAADGWMWSVDAGMTIGNLGEGTYPAGFQYANGVITIDLNSYEGPSTTDATNFGVETRGKGQYQIDLISNTDYYSHSILLNVLPCETHTWTDATCTTPKTCSACGATEGEKNPEAHNYVDGKCEYCGAASATTAGYTVAASEDDSIIAGENAEVIITVTETESKAYNAYELNVTYPEGLTYVSASGSGVEGDNFQANHDDANRTIQIIGYGADKDSGTAAAKLTFTGSATGEYDVTITSAKVDAAASAPTQDTPDATIGDAATKITITGYTVTLGDGLTADSTVAYPGTDFTFKATDADNYDYTVTAKVGETVITVNDNGDGTYTIPADQITGNITVSAVMTAKTYNVTYDGTTTENAATYNTDYVFTPAKDGYTVGGVTVTIGGEAYTGYSNVDGTYTIPGADITGDIVITVDWIEETPATVTVGKSEGVIGGDTATEGTDYTFSFGDTDNYEYDEETLVVKVGDTDITDKVTKNEETGEYTIPGNLITGDITIEVSRTEKSTLAVDVVEYLTVDGGNMYLVTVKGVPEGSVAKYDGVTMYWSEKYEAYAWLVISTDTLENVKTAAAAAVTAAEGNADLTVDYSGDVNGTEKVDVNDAQLVYNMYKAYYGDFDTVSMQKFLDADMNGDGTVDVSDAAAVVTAIVNAK